MPKNWSLVQLKDIGRIVSGGTPSTSDSSYWSDEISWITPADLSGYEAKFISKGRKSISKKGLENSSAKLLPKGSVLFSSRAPIGYVAIASSEVATNQGFKNIIPSKDVISDFLYYYLKASKQLAEASASGTTFKEISGTKFGELPMPLPPLDEQHAIVSKIEELLSELDKGKQQLETAQQQLKIYRQAVLKWAFEGKLILQKDKWNLKAFKYCLSFSQGIQVDVELQRLEKTSEKQVRFLRIIDFTQGNDAPRYIENPGERYSVSKDEVALVRYGASTGFVCTGLEGVIANNLFKVTPNNSVDKKFLYYFLVSPFFQNVIAQNVKGAAMPAISFGLINDVLLPIPSLSEQHQIVQEIESRLSVCDKVEETITTSLAQAETLRQSILKKAFEGRLI